MKTPRADTTFNQLTLRLPRGLHARARKMAKARRTSVNTLVRLLLEQMDRRDREKELVKAYDSLAGDSDVSPFFEAQARVARRG